jgi:hypothetical protein
MTRDEIRAIEHDLQATMMRFFLYLDAHDGEAAAKLFTPDAEWRAQRGPAVKGPKGVAANISGRPQGYVSRHCLANFVVEVADANNARSQGYVTVYGVDGGNEPAKLPVQLGLPRSILHYHDRFVRTPEGWRIAEQWSDRVFTSV